MSRSKALTIPELLDLGLTKCGFPRMGRLPTFPFARFKNDSVR